MDAVIPLALWTVLPAAIGWLLIRASMRVRRDWRDVRDEHDAAQRDGRPVDERRIPSLWHSLQPVPMKLMQRFGALLVGVAFALSGYQLGLTQLRGSDRDEAMRVARVARERDDVQRYQRCVQTRPLSIVANAQLAEDPALRRRVEQLTGPLQGQSGAVPTPDCEKAYSRGLRLSGRYPDLAPTEAPEPAIRPGGSRP